MPGFVRKSDYIFITLSRKRLLGQRISLGLNAWRTPQNPVLIVVARADTGMC
jgi:hypothetical protein